MESRTGTTSFSTQTFHPSIVSAATIAEALGLRRVGRDYRGGCPLCGGDSRFTLTEKDGRLLWKCWAGCDQSALTAELRARALYPERERRQFTEAERKDYGRRRRAAEAEARQLLAWRGELLDWLACESASTWARYRLLRGRIVDRGLDQRGGGWYANKCEHAEAWGQCLDRLRDRVKAAPWSELLAIYRRQANRRGAAA